MAWKDWSYWLKGGIIGFLILVLLFVIDIFIKPFTMCFGNCDNLPQLLLIIQSIIDSLGARAFSGNLQHWITTILSYCIIGSIIGFIYGKIKKH